MKASCLGQRERRVLVYDEVKKIDGAKSHGPKKPLKTLRVVKFHDLVYIFQKNALNIIWRMS